jgi:alpha-glucoside transport system substrate-binding protein
MANGSWLPAATLGLAVGFGLLIAASCSTPTDAAPGALRVVVSWTGQELTAFRSVISTFTARTGSEVEYIETRDLEGTIRRQLAAGQRVDLAGLTGPAHMAELARSGALRDLRDAIDLGAYKAHVAPTFVELGTVDGRLVGAFIKSTGKGLIWFNPKVYRLGVPPTWSDLQRVSVQAARNDTRPWCMGFESRESSGWPGTDWIEEIVLRQSGPQVYDSWVGGRLAWTSREVRRAFEFFGQVVADGAVAGGVNAALNTNFADAGEPLFTTPPGCLFLNQGSFMPLFLASHGHTAGTDFDFFPFPEIDPAFAGGVVGAGDLFGLLSNRPIARQLIAFLVSSEGQGLLVSAGGGLSVNAHVRTYPNVIAARAASMLSSADHFRFDGSDLMPPAMSAAFLQAVLDFTARPGDMDTILQHLDTIRQTAYGH